MIPNSLRIFLRFRLVFVLKASGVIELRLFFVVCFGVYWPRLVWLRLRLLRLKPCDDFLFLDLPVGCLAGDTGDDLLLKVVVMREYLRLVVGDFEQYRECKLCGT